ncbi:MAG: DUF1015 domain-containing protein, partial [Acidobacteria bacterium]|nr:DUF1015 domain-containing protein [Acidobacteriota bacterium]
MKSRVSLRGKLTSEIPTSSMADIAFLLNPPTMDDVLEIAEAGLRMPHNSTYFYPK